jgi:hypothetical protein
MSAGDQACRDEQSAEGETGNPKGLPPPLGHSGSDRGG